ncbi:BUD13 homolog [Plutella xylostella]|uniref:BUD13 homolog n=1 Tax=Plutella xylostella TaxID=51655 RepID=UPI002032A538|nr:BUD13 homolog [Plutella xylostella]
MTTTKIDQKAYLQKYLTGSSGDKKKKKKKKAPKPTGLKIIDDDLDYSKLRSLDGDELDILDQGEDAPQIAGIIDERPEEVIKAEEYSNRSSKWRVITQDDGFNSKLKIEEITKDKKQKEKENEIIFGKMYSDSEDEEKKGSDASPPRKSTNSKQKPDISKKPQNNSDSDFSPPRKNSKRSPPPKTTKSKKDYDSDVSPVRKSSSSHQKSHKSKNRQDNSDSDFSPPRKDSRTSSPPRKASSSKNNYDSEVSQPRKHDSRNQSREKTKKPSRWGGYDESREKESSKSRRKSPESDIPVPRKSRKYSSDASPPRKTNSSSKRRKSPSEDPLPPRWKKNYDSDQSPPRKSRKDSPKRRKSPDSDASPPRKRRSSIDKHKDQRSQKRRQSSDSDMSPPRKNQRHRAPSQDSDASPPRKNRRPESPQRIDKNSRRRNDDSPPPSNKKMEKTLDGKLAGLQDAGMLRKENEAFRRREDEVFSKMTDDVSGRNAQVVSRKTGKKRETSEERRQQQEKAEKQKVIDDLYKKWGKGLKQIEQQESRYQDFVHEAAKPLARHRDDKDLESTLKDVERDGDPMLAYIREKKRDRGELPPELPTYKGNFPPNRFNIRPGFRWDGVDRSNGYETKYFDTQSKKKAQADEYYKWSSADM